MCLKKMLRNIRKQPFIVQVVLVVGIALAVRYLLSSIEGYTGASEFVLYHMKGCPHCTNMMPEWSKFVSNNKTGVKTRKVEASDAPAEVKKQGVSGFPTLLLLDGQGNKVKAYNGPRTAKGFSSFCSKNA